MSITLSFGYHSRCRWKITTDEFIDVLIGMAAVCAEADCSLGSENHRNSKIYTLFMYVLFAWYEVLLRSDFGQMFITRLMRLVWSWSVQTDQLDADTLKDPY
jgi:hypothetical protein